MLMLRFIIILFLALSLSSCQTSGEWPNSDWQFGGVSLDETDREMFKSWQRLDAQFNCCAATIWDENYRPQDEPVFFVRTQNGRFQYGYIINHPSPWRIADAVQIDIPAMQNMGDIYLIRRIDPNIFAHIGNFDFELPIGGSDVFAVTYQKRSAKKIRAAKRINYQNPGEISFADVASDDWILFLAHEIFHRHQFKQWVALENNQNLDSYDFSQENIALILLEQQILKSGLKARTTNAARQTLIEYATIRNYRKRRFGRQIETLDSAQEIYEGSSRFIEHRLGHLLKNADLNRSNFANQIENDEEIYPGIDVRDILGFGRFYASGAAVAALMDRAEIDWKTSIKTAPSFAQIIVQNYGTVNDLRLVRNAQIRHDYRAIFRKAEQYHRLIQN